MKRRHLFEFEDQRWFPDFLRVCITRYIMFIHRLFGTSEKIETHLSKLMSETGQKKIVDLCSGAGGPMIEVYKNLKKRKEFGDLELMMSDLYPNKAQAHKVNGLGDKRLTYSLVSVDATSPNAQYDGIRTMVASFHHMPVAAAKKILQSVCDTRQPVLIYELSDNSHPILVNWITLPIGVLMVLIFTPFVRPLSLSQIVFTYLIPILPLITAWDGAVSNIRTYTFSDLDELIAEVKGEAYSWEKIALEGRAGKSLILIGKPGKDH